MNSSSKPLILVVDDDQDMLKLIEQFFIQNNYHVITSNNGTDAINKTRDSKPDLILLDVMMPGMNGYDVCKRLKKNRKTSDIPVIFVTAMADTEEEARGLELGAIDYIKKPFSPPIVQARVRNHLLLVAAKRKLERQNKELIELNQLKNKFLGMAAHDLRNPLTSIRGFSEIILNEEIGPVYEGQKEFLKIINTTSDEMLTLLNELLDISVIESGKLELRLKNGSLNKLLEKRIKVNEVIAKRKNITIHSELVETPDILFDSNRIAQIFDNIVSNAIKFSPQGTNVFINMKIDDNMVKVSIKDEGPGISEEDQSRLFGEFQRLSAQPTGGEKSTGLGLAIVKKMVEAHKGKLTVESSIGSGSTFSFELPMGG